MCGARRRRARRSARACRSKAWSLMATGSSASRRTISGRLTAGATVIASGAWSTALLAPAAIDVPIGGERLQIVSTAPPAAPDRATRLWPQCHQAVRPVPRPALGGSRTVHDRGRRLATGSFSCPSSKRASGEVLLGCAIDYPDDSIRRRRSPASAQIAEGFARDFLRSGTRRSHGPGPAFAFTSDQEPVIDEVAPALSSGPVTPSATRRDPLLEGPEPADRRLGTRLRHHRDADTADRSTRSPSAPRPTGEAESDEPDPGPRWIRGDGVGGGRRLVQRTDHEVTVGDIRSGRRRCVAAAAAPGGSSASMSKRPLAGGRTGRHGRRAQRRTCATTCPSPTRRSPPACTWSISARTTRRRSSSSTATRPPSGPAAGSCRAVAWRPA